MRKEITATKRSAFTAIVVFFLLLVLILPWSNKVSVPAVMHHPQTASIYAPEPGKVVSHVMQEGRIVRAGDMLLQLHSPNLESEIELTQYRIALLKARIARAGADDEERSFLQVLSTELAGESKKMEGLFAKKHRLAITAPFAGRLTNVDVQLGKDMWLNESHRLAIIRPFGKPAFSGLVSGTERHRIFKNATGYFLPDNSEYAKIPLKVASISDIAAHDLGEIYLADIYGGKISVLPASGNEDIALKPRGTWFPVEFEMTQSIASNPGHVLQGVAVVEGKRESHAAKALRRVGSILVREFGF